jgi:RNA polymerase sigma-70 factor (ECF subfamily)
MTRTVAVVRDEELDSFEAFYRREYRPVLGLAIALTRDRFAAEDLTQEAFLAAEGDWSRVGHLDRPGAWVRKVVANKSVSRWRRLVAEARALRRMGTPRNVPSNQELSSEAAEVWAAVRLLPRRQAQVLALTYLDDLSTKEVGEVLGCSAATVKTHLQRGRLALARRLGVEEDS